MFVLCDLSTTTTYLFCVYLKISIGDMLVYPSTARGYGAINYTLFIHEMAFFLFAMNIFVVAGERLLHGKFLQCCQDNRRLWNFLTVISALFSILVSFCASYLQHIIQYGGPSAVTMNLLQFSGIFMLLLTIQINKKAYIKGRGEHLERRYECAQTYYYNVALFRYLLGSVICRFLAFSCCVVLILADIKPSTFGWLSFAYHNINAISNSIFPWILILRNKKIRCLRNYRTKCSGSEIGIVVNDLTGKALDTTATGEKYFHLLQQSW